MIPAKSAKQIADAFVAALETNFNQAVPLLRGFNRKLSKVLGGTYVSLDKLAGSILLQFHPATAAYKEIQVGVVTINPLKMWGELVGINRKTGQRAERTVDVTVLTQGGTLTSGELIVNRATQMVYQVVGDVPLNATTVQATIRATRIGEIGNVDIGTTLHFVNAPDDVEKNVTVAAGAWVDGTDEETVEELRERILERFLAWPQGGAMADYKHWAEEVDGVLNAYPYSGWVDPEIPGFEANDMRAGKVVVYIEDSVDPDGIPSAALRQQVKDHIEFNNEGLAHRRNINTYPTVLSIQRTAFQVEIIGFAATDLASGREAIQDAVADFMLKRQPGGQAGYTVLLPRKDIVSETEVAGVASRVAAAYGGTVSGAIIRVNGQRVPVTYLQEGIKAKLDGDIVWG